MWAMRLQGRSCAEIADLFDVSEDTVASTLKRMLDEKTARNGDQAMLVHRLEDDRLDALLEAIWPHATNAIAEDPETGEPERDDNGRLRRLGFDKDAADLLLKIHDRRMKLHGLDKVRIELTAKTGAAFNYDALDPDEIAILEVLLAKARGGLSPGTLERAALPSSTGAERVPDTLEGELVNAAAGPQETET